MSEAIAKTGFGIIGFAIFSGFCIVALKMCEIDLKVKAEKQAREWVTDMGFSKDAHVSCVNRDTDGDGYVSCTIKQGDNLTFIECVGSDYTWNEGCRAPKLKIPTPVNVQSGD